ncbi:unnamed protein product [Dovyalis caffra]|uniref:F-box/LRR-repeat protein 15-like leucin rich repeat domain-containing protein n=1 Tax=Dovyalis caffra TaxID=77055 RepID=A0AAV1SMH3_9ROSI|nr:unnamed protein product [Dovyalis caffra]
MEKTKFVHNLFTNSETQKRKITHLNVGNLAGGGRQESEAVRQIGKESKSRGILPTHPQNGKLPTPEPLTPIRTREPSAHQSPPSLVTTPNPRDTASTRRRSLRLASKSLPSADVSLQTPTSKRKKTEDKEARLVNEGNMIDKTTELDVGGELLGVLSLRSGKKVVNNNNNSDSGDDSVVEIERELEGEVKDSSVMSTKGKHKGKGRGKLGKQVLTLDVQEEFVEILSGNTVKRSKECVSGGNLEEKLSVNESASSRKKRKCTRQVKMERGEGGGIAVEELGKRYSANESGTSRRRGKHSGEVKVEGVKEGVVEELEKTPSTDEDGILRRGRRYSREEKGKNGQEAAVVIEELGENAVALESGTSRGGGIAEKTKGRGYWLLMMDTLRLEPRVKDLVDGLAESVVLEEGKQDVSARSKVPESRMEQFRDTARKNASRFAHFEMEEDGEDHHDVEMPSEEEELDKVEDWPGPFSTAVKIIRDRANRLNLQKGGSTLEKAKPVPITWIPKTGRASKRLKELVPSLQELCMNILVKNADAIASLEHVPDALRHRLCQLLCDSRRMNSRFLALLVHGSPTEIQIRDCSWLAEEEFKKILRTGLIDLRSMASLLKAKTICLCLPSSHPVVLSEYANECMLLYVLQLDQCGRCMADYILLATLARSQGSLPMLTTLSISGACRLSDAALSSLVSSAPVLQSLNLSQCSLLTSSSIDALSDSLATTLRELYINDCQSMDPMLILPALKKLEHLEVLSLSGIQTVSDKFLREFIVARGHNIKELVLTDCVKLTDSSMKVIAETCSKLCALDLCNLRKLTDSALGFLANDCREIHTLKLCRNAFRLLSGAITLFDEAIAAFVETSGERLKELSLNNVKKVGHNTALSVARRSRKLLSLDLSWCRNLSNEAVGLIADSCLSLKVLKLFGCSQITKVFLDGHSNSNLKIIGLKMTPVLEDVRVPEPQEFPLRYSSASSSI